MNLGGEVKYYSMPDDGILFVVSESIRLHPASMHIMAKSGTGMAMFSMGESTLQPTCKTFTCTIYDRLCKLQVVNNMSCSKKYLRLRVTIVSNKVVDRTEY